jgi:hypothetical protein
MRPAMVMVSECFMLISIDIPGNGIRGTAVVTVACEFYLTCRLSSSPQDEPGIQPPETLGTVKRLAWLPQDLVRVSGGSEMLRRTKSRWIGCAILAFGTNAVAAAMPPATPEIFAPGIISGHSVVACPAFSPDGKTVFFDITRGSDSMLLVSHQTNGHWSKPQIAPFSGQWLDHDAAMAPDGSFLVFVSNRPAVAGGKPVDIVGKTQTIPNLGGNLWRVDGKGAGWGEPYRLPDSINHNTQTFAPSVAADGSVYFIQPEEGDFHIFRSQYRDGTYQPPVRQALGDAKAHQKDPAVAPDESFMVFDMNDPAKEGPDRLYIAFRDGVHWGEPIDLGAPINDSRGPWGPHLGPDHRTLYFTSDRTLPMTYPHTLEEGKRQLAETQTWDNGLDNIWRVSLAPWLDAHRSSL